MSNARNLANLLGTDTKIKTADIADEVFNSNRSLIINGAAQIWQRGTSATANGYLQDRWYSYVGANGLTYSVSRSTDVPSGQGFKYSNKMSATGGTYSVGSGYAMHRQYIEAQNVRHLAYGTSNAKQLTLSFWAKASARTGTGIANFMHYGDGTQRQCSASFTIDATNTWQKITVTIPADTGSIIGNSDNASGVYFDIMFGGPSDWSSGTTLNTSWKNNVTGDRAVGITQFMQASGDAVYLTGIQLEVGDKATPFEHRSYGEELTLCQRYFQVVGNSAYFAGNGVGSASIAVGVPLATPMRAEPSVPDTGYKFHRSGNTNSGTNSVTSVTYATIGASNLQLRVNFGSGISDEVAYVLNATTADLQLDAEL